MRAIHAVLAIARIEDERNNKPFLLIEVYLTTDGMRTRVCNGRWGTLEEAKEEKKRREGFAQ